MVETVVEATRRAVKDEHEAYDIVRRYSPGELSREVQILLESLFE